MRSWLLLILVVSVLVRAPTMFGVKRTGWDEHAYVFFARTFHEQGVPGIQGILAHYGTDEKLNQSPLPLRITFVALASVACQILGSFHVDNVAWLSFCSGVGLVLIGTLFAHRLAGNQAALLTACLLISSPLAAGLSRRAMQDTFVALVFVLVLFLFDRCWRRGSRTDHAMFGLAFTIALLTKESAVFLVPLMACAGVYYAVAMRIRPPWGILVPLAVAPLLYLCLASYLAGGLERLIATYRTYAALQGQLPYPLRYEQGPWFVYLLTFVAVAPVALIAAVVGFVVPAEEPSRRGRDLALIYVVSGMLLFAQLPIVNVRLVLFLDVFLRIGAVLGVIYLASLAAPRWRIPLAGAAIAVIALMDAAQFYHVFIHGDVYNPSTFRLLRVQGFYNLDQ